MDQTPKTPAEVKKLENTPLAQTASNTLLIIGLVIGIFSLLAITSYFFFVKTYSAKMEERKENALLYDDPNQKNILGAQITDLPELEIGGNKAMNKQPTMTQQQLMQAQMMQQQQAAAQQQAPGQAHPQSKTAQQIPPTPSTTPVPENIYANKDLGFQLENQSWAKQAQTKDGEITVDSYKKDDGSLILNITSTTKKYDTVKAYIDSHPRGRTAQNSTDFKMGGKSGMKTDPYTVNANGVDYRSTAAYVQPKDGDGMIGIELDSTSLDVNDHSAEDVFKKITDSFSFIDKKTP